MYFGLVYQVIGGGGCFLARSDQRATRRPEDCPTRKSTYLSSPESHRIRLEMMTGVKTTGLLR
jgi:hypothetical protein